MVYVTEDTEYITEVATRSCPKCHIRIPWLTYCVACGEHLPEDIIAFGRIRKKKCPYCGIGTYYKATYCGFCGKQIQDTEIDHVEYEPRRIRRPI